MGLVSTVKSLFSSGTSETQQPDGPQQVEDLERSEEEGIDRIEEDKDALDGRLKELVDNEKELEQKVNQLRGQKELEYYPGVLKNVVEVFEQVEDLSEELERIEQELSTAVGKEKDIQTYIDVHEKKLEQSGEELEKLEEKAERELGKILQAARDISYLPEQNREETDADIMKGILTQGAPESFHDIEDGLRELSGILNEEFDGAHDYLTDEMAWQKVEHAGERQVDEIEQEFQDLKNEIKLLQDSKHKEEEILEDAKSIREELKERQDFEYLAEKDSKTSFEGNLSLKDEDEELKERISKMFRDIDRVERDTRQRTVFEKVSESSEKIKDYLETLKNLRRRNKERERKIIEQTGSLEEKISNLEHAMQELEKQMDEQISKTENWMSYIEERDVEAFFTSAGLTQSYLEKLSEESKSEIDLESQLTKNINLYRFNCFSVKTRILGYGNISEDEIEEYMHDHTNSRRFKQERNREGLLPRIENLRQNFDEARTELS